MNVLSLSEKDGISSLLQDENRNFFTLLSEEAGLFDNHVLQSTIEEVVHLQNDIHLFLCQRRQCVVAADGVLPKVLRCFQ